MMVKIGDTIRDNDPRMQPRRLKVVGMEFTANPDRTYVKAESPGGSVFRIRLNRIYTDGKPRRSGFSLEAKR